MESNYASSSLKIASLTQKHGTPLSTEDIKNICDDVRNGMSYIDVRKKYTIGGSRLARILKICNVKSIVKGGWEKMNPIDIQLNGNKKEHKSGKNSSKTEDTNDVYQSILEGLTELKKNKERRK